MPKNMLMIAMLAGSVCLSCATSPYDEASLPAAITPEVQTAEWAQDWWMPRHEAKLAEIREGDVDLVMIGDSITHGWESGGKATWEKYYAGRNALNLGFSGDRTEQVIWRLQHGAVDGISPRLCVVMIGTNNTGHRQDPADETALGIEYIVEELRNRLPEAKVLILAIFPRGETPRDELRELNDEINARIARLADNEDVFFLDINHVFLEEHGNLPRSIMPDLLHPNPEGYKLWAEAMEPMVARLMAD